MNYNKLCNKFLSITFFLGAFFSGTYGQEVFFTFKDTRVINTHSVETLPAHELDIRISHRFGDLLGDRGGWTTFFGLETASDIMIGAEYGVSKDVTIGLNRTKGAGDLRQLVNGLLKVRLSNQTSEGKTPFSLTFVGTGTISTMQKSDDPEALNFFEVATHRASYSLQMLVARKFSNALSVQIGGGLLHRNIVGFNDENNIYFLNAAAKLQLTKVLGFVVDFTRPISDRRETETDFYNPLGVGFEIETGGHVFQITFTNSTGIAETDFIPYTRTNWGDLEFRLGFSISRRFNL